MMNGVLIYAVALIAIVCHGMEIDTDLMMEKVVQMKAEIGTKEPFPDEFLDLVKSISPPELITVPDLTSIIEKSHKYEQNDLINGIFGCTTEEKLFNVFNRACDYGKVGVLDCMIPKIPELFPPRPDVFGVIRVEQHYEVLYTRLAHVAFLTGEPRILEKADFMTPFISTTSVRFWLQYSISDPSRANYHEMVRFVMKKVLQMKFEEKIDDQYFLEDFQAIFNFFEKFKQICLVHDEHYWLPNEVLKPVFDFLFPLEF